MIITETGNVAIHEHLGSSIKRSRCVLKLDKNDIDKFRRLVFYHESELVYLKLVPREGVSIKDDPSTVGANIWTWTYYGKHGGIKFLRWPIEFGIWSTGLLNNYVFSKPMEMNLKWDSGNCSNLHVGNNEDDTIISAALLSLSVAMNNVEPDKYNATFFCYKRRNFIEGDFLYNLCKNIMCPIEALKYHCCNTYYNATYGKRLLTCSRTTFVYDTISWILPALGSVILIVVSPLFFLKAVHKFSRYGNSEFDCQMEGLNRHMTLVNDNNQSVVSEFVFHDGGHHVTLFRTLLRPFCLCFRYVISSSHPYMFSVWKRFIRFSIVAYPKESYGYLIFAFTIVYYICQSVHEFSLKYQSLLKDTIAVCEHMQRANDATKLIARNDGLKGIRIELFERVINEHCPKRRQVFICFVKVCVIIIAYGLAINLLLQTDGFRKLQTLTHAGTVIFVCALPQITRSICKKSTGIFKKKKLRIEISHTISDYFGYFNMVDPSGIEMVDEE
ncbi:hypothetical protein ACF0H5_003374 [Mactra antiquata]